MADSTPLLQKSILLLINTSNVEEITVSKLILPLRPIPRRSERFWRYEGQKPALYPIGFAGKVFETEQFN